MKKLLKLIFRRKRMLLIDLDELRNDKGFRIGWEANIAMAMKDEAKMFALSTKKMQMGTFDNFTMYEMNQIFGHGASKFIDLLTHEHIGI